MSKYNDENIQILINFLENEMIKDRFFSFEFWNEKINETVVFDRDKNWMYAND